MSWKPHLDQRTQYATWQRPPVRTVSCECCQHLVGKRRGSLTVLGVTRGHTVQQDRDLPKQPPRWVVKCDCGAYDLRRRRPLHGRENMDDKCGFCWAKEKDFRREFFAKHGRNPDYLDMMEASP